VILFAARPLPILRLLDSCEAIVLSQVDSLGIGIHGNRRRTMTDSPIWLTEFGEGPLVACAIHDGHEVRRDVADCLQLNDAQRRYEEDPHTGEWTAIASTRILGRRSRFEVDLNRPRDKAVYLEPADAWGLEVWKYKPTTDMVNRSLQAYDDFYAHLRHLLERLVADHGQVVVFDLHSYNHVREGADGAAADSDGNPEINLGTGTMARALWSPVVDRWLTAIRGYDYLGRRLDVRENVKFVGGHLPQWIHENFANSVCALAIEVKKFFMNEWTGELDQRQYAAIGGALAHAAAAVSDELERVKRGPTVA
jgi:N-formylglutamate amidohydrolase